MNNSNKWQISLPGDISIPGQRIMNSFTINPPTPASPKSLKMIAAQRQHLKKLQEKLEEDERNFFYTLTNIPGWELFITRHTSTYQCPKDVIPHLKNYFRGIEIEFDKEDGMPSEAKFTIRYAEGNGYKSYQHCKFRTNSIPISDIENFIQNKGE